MPIQNIGSMQEILGQHNAKAWSKDASIDSLQSVEFGDLGRDLKLPKTEGHQSFSEMLSTSMMDVNQLQKDADVAVQKLASGQTKNLHETMLAVEKAEIAFKTMNQIRTKVIDAYKEIMRMQV